jgi:hypothetical protein
MVHALDESNFYQRGCNDGASLVFSLITLCAIIGLIVSNYLATWPVYMPGALFLSDFSVLFSFLFFFF